MKNWILLFALFTNLTMYGQSGLYTMDDNSKLIISPSYKPDFRYRRTDGTSGRLYRQKDSSFISAPGWAKKENPNIFVWFKGGDISFSENGKVLHGKKAVPRNIPLTFGDSLYGELFLPVKGSPNAVVVLQFGSGQESAVASNYLQYLLPIDNIAVFVFDKRGTGKSAGKYTADFITMAKDMAAAVEKIREQPEVKKIPLGVMGESQGGWVVPLTASLTKVDFVISSYGLAISPQEENRQEMINGLPDTSFLRPALEVAAVTDRIVKTKFREGLQELAVLKSKYGNEEWYKTLNGDYTGLVANATETQMSLYKAMFNFDIDLEYDPMPALRKVKEPMLWVVAGKDTEAPNTETIARLKQLQSEGSHLDLIIFPNADHGMIEIRGKELLGKQSDGYFRLLKDWILTRKISRQYGDAIQLPFKR
ncbi:S9 family peptidase [Chitinophaga sp. S165]|uniref:alpha/beta hydrolase family protein n=1 Tax=Chitinophaga sp. S165 TaxID=2135462 RepID=UPI000D718E0B|nr:alpha/beta hydrolase [Chitinophaga sp. S165]